MNLNKVIQTIFIMLALVGVFAAMARNGYGFDFIGVACFGLAALFLIQLVWKVVNEYGTLLRSDITEMAELLLLSLLMLMFGLRTFYIYIDRADIIFSMVCVFQLALYAWMGYHLFSSMRVENKALALRLIFFYLSLTFFFLSILTRTKATLSMTFGLLALLSSIPFFISLAKRERFEIHEKSVTVLTFIIKSKNKAGLLFLFFISSALFTGLSYFKIIPTIENVDRPTAYVELINQAESGNEKPVNGQYQHEKYKEVMDKFLERHGEGGGK
jgi:hypothetical protein